MAKVRKVVKNGGTRWRVSWYDALGQRHQRFFARKEDAERVLSDAIKASQQRLEPAIDPNVSVDGYAKHWLPLHAGARGLAPNTVESYESTLRLHVADVVLPGRGTRIGDLKVARLTRPMVRALLAAKRDEGYSRNSLRIMHAVLHAMLDGAVEDGLLVANPAAGLRKALRLVAASEARTQEVKALTQTQLDTFLATAQEVSALFDLYLLLARTGLRLGEGLALQDTDPEVFDFEERTLRVVRSLGKRGALGTPKSGHAREVDLSQELVTVLRARLTRKKKDTLAHGWPALPAWVFYTANGTPYSPRNVLRDFKRVLTKADLPGHFHPHCLRHTFASLHILDGAKPTWVQQQLGHSSLKLTMDVYGRWFRLRDHAAADRQDTRSGLVVTSAVTKGGQAG